MKPGYLVAAGVLAVLFMGASQTAVAMGIRNNNPLNIKWYGREDWQNDPKRWRGMVGVFTDWNGNKFVIFDSVENGYRAAAVILKNYQRIYGINTIEGIIGRWAKADGRPVATNYAGIVADEVGVGVDEALDLVNDDATLAAVMKAMSKVELGVGQFAYSDEQIMAGVQRA